MSVYSINTSNLAISGASSGLAALGLATHGGSLYAIKTDGLIELTGADDEGVAIVGVLKSGKIKFGSSSLKRSRRLYLEGTASKGLSVEVTTEEWGQSKTRPYKVNRLKGDLRPHASKIAGKPKSQYFQVQISNANGGTMKLRNMEMLVENLDRKI